MPPNPPRPLKFLSWQRSPIYDLVPNETRVAGRLAGKLLLTLRDEQGSDVGHGAIPFHMTAPKDIAGIKPQAIIRTAPPALGRDAETTKLVHVDFFDPDLPWRYTPQKAAGDKLFPWIVLLVGTPDEMKVQNQDLVILEESVLKAHDLAQSFRWAHVQDDGEFRLSRIFSPRRPLKPQSEYLAAIVPAFDEEGEAAWGLVAKPRTSALPLFHHWRFWTAEEGDFRTLAMDIMPRKAGNLGVAPLLYQRAEVQIDLEVRGAITRLGDDPDGDPEARAREDLAAFKQAVDDLQNQEPLQRRVIGLPTYGPPWLPGAADARWTQTLNTDPRFRGTAGLWMGIEAQEELVDAASRQLGALDLAAHLVRNLALGLESARGLWARRLPEGTEARLMIFSPLMRRMLASNGPDTTTAMARITGPESPLEAELFSTAARRMLRRNSAWLRYGKTGFIGRRDLIRTANQCAPQPDKPLPGMPHIDLLAAALGLPEAEHADVLKMLEIPPGIMAVIGKLEGRVIDFENPEFRDLLADLSRAIREAHEGCELHQKYLQQHQGDTATCELLIRAVRLCLGNNGWLQRRNPEHGEHVEPGGLRDFLVTMLPGKPCRHCAPPDLEHVVGVIAKAIDPHEPQPPAWRRIQSRISGLDIRDLAPPELPVGLDFPTWTLLRERAKEWLLPNVDELEKDSVVALQTNPTFIDAYLVGLNTQFVNEMHWRNLAVARNSTPLRMFWGHVNFETQQRDPDIQPLEQWGAETELGDLSHQVLQPGDASGKRDLIILFRTDLFRRYPATLVYLVKPGADLDGDLKATPVFDFQAENRATRTFFGPVFQGNITADVVFFAFDIDPDDLDKHWLVLDQPLSELRFRGIDENGTMPMDSTHAAAQAKRLIDEPARVAISGAYLKELGLALT